MLSEEVNWSLSCLGQTNDSGEMKCPAQSKRKDRGAGYESLSNVLSPFKGNHSIPMNIPEFLTNDANLQESLMIYNTIEEPSHASPAKTRKLSRCSTNKS